MDESFERFQAARSTNWFDDDPLLQELLAHFAAPTTAEHDDLRRWGARSAGPLQELARASAQQAPHLPRLEHFDPYGHRVDRVVLPEATLRSLAEVAGREKLGAPHGNPYTFYSKGYLYGQNGEAGVVCSLGCTDGMVRALEALGGQEAHRQAVERIRGSSPDRVWHGAQFVTEPQGGSDVPANRVEATPGPEEGTWRIHGRKWFCSNVNANYFLVTARPRGGAVEASGGGPPVGLFLVPAYLEGDGLRNGHTVDRLKEKLGTRELATAEVTFQGAVAYPVGPLEEGLSNLLRYVLTPSRVYCVQNAASTLRQAERLATAYTEARTAFGSRVRDFPLARARLEEIRRARRRALAVYFDLVRLWEASSADPAAGADFRVLLSLAKPVLTAAATARLRDAMTLLGGNGIEERFSPLPRLYRDSAIMEIWEGPHDVLFTQALRDMGRFGMKGSDLVGRAAGTAPASAPGVEEGSSAPGATAARAHDPEVLGRELDAVLRDAAGGERDATVPFACVAPRLVEAWADRVLAESVAAPLRAL